MGLFDKRVEFKPFEYKDIIQYKTAINHSYWLVSEWNFVSDIHDFRVNLTEIEQNALKNALLAISQIEVSVKKFWTKLGDRFPKAEFDQVGVSFGESEIRHADAYSHLLQVLGLNEDFKLLLENPTIKGRVDYLTKYISTVNVSNKDYAFVLALFAIFVENVSLFSQFLVIKSYNKYLNILKDIDNVVQATQKEETIHAMFGSHLISLIKQEYPEWFDEAFYVRLNKVCDKAYKAELEIIDWIFEAGELWFLPKITVQEFLKDRFNQSLEMIGGKKRFDVDKDILSDIQWFDEEILAEVSTDFFHKKPVSYSKKMQAITAGDLF